MGAQIKDVDLLKLSGVVLPSPSQAGVSYRLEEPIGEGAHGVVFLALQRLPRALAPVVVKLLRPRAVRELAGLAGASIGKEVAALKRLSERAPPTPFVVQFLDAGTYRLAESALDLPWLAVEYIHGGLEGTTLRSRVQGSLSRTGFAFELHRARSAIQCIASGIMAIHEVGVLHRDVNPGNVLCCGFGETEIFKIADFGLARVSSASTFGNVLLGTPGYCAPEQSFPDKVGVGTYSDVFSMACTAYFLLSGEPYFSAPSIPEMLVAVQGPERSSLLDARGTCPEIRERRALCLEIDQLLARATRADPRERPQTAQELGAALLTLLAQAGVAAPSLSSSSSLRHDERRAAQQRDDSHRHLRWTVCSQPGTARAVRHLAWDANGHFLATSGEGLLFWDGTGFRSVPFDWPWIPRVVQRSGAGRWLLAGDHGTLVDFVDGKVERRLSAGNSVSFVAAAGRFDDIIVAAADRGPSGIELWTWINGRFMEPLPVPDVRKVHACTALSDTAWLFVGEASDGSGILLEFRPLGRRAHVASLVPGRAVRACASQVESGIALAAGDGGYFASIVESQARESSLQAELEISAVAVDVLGREWAASPGSVWTRNNAWERAWHDPTWSSPFVGIMADVGRIIAVTHDGGIVLGERAPSGHHQVL